MTACEVLYCVYILNLGQCTLECSGSNLVDSMFSKPGVLRQPGLNSGWDADDVILVLGES